MWKSWKRLRRKKTTSVQIKVESNIYNIFIKDNLSTSNISNEYSSKEAIAYGLDSYTEIEDNKSESLGNDKSSMEI